MEPQETPKQTVETKLDQPSKILFAIVAALIAGSIAMTFWRIVVKRDYIVQAKIDCDPTVENCFVWKCDPNSTDETERCTGDPEKDTWYYKILRRNAQNIPLCDPKDENCKALTCEPGEKDCSEELCTPENVPEGETCNDPQQYLIENPPEEESEECAPDDQECLDLQSESSSEDQACAPDDEECTQNQETAPNSDNSDSSNPEQM